MAPRVELEVLEHAELPLDEIGIAITRQSAWRAAGISAESRPRIIAEAVEDRTGKPTHEFAGLAFDSATNQGWEIRGDVNYLDSINMVPTAATPLPSQEELLEAAQILRADDAFARIAEEGVVIYQPMPPLADVEQLDGTAIRRVTLGIRRPSGGPKHHIVAVDIARRTVDWYPTGVHSPTDDDCERRLPDPVGSNANAGGPRRVRVRVIDGSVELWNFQLVRPRDSEPVTYGKGSGIELRNVFYRSKLVLYRAHVPILNVLYDDNVNYRDWQNAETVFQAVGQDPVGPGWRLCTQPPKTILESGTDAGNFQGVALHYQNGELRIVSEMMAGWYRYVSDWRMRDDGTIGARFGFAGTRNPRTCMRHQHHVYWRFDFDINGAANDALEVQRVVIPTGGGPARLEWHPVVKEAQWKRNPAIRRRYRVVDKASGSGYQIRPSSMDGTADNHGVADMWVLRYNGQEIDDGVSIVGGQVPSAQTQAQISRFVSGDPVDGQDIVVWYAGHFLHDEHHSDPSQGHIFGPDLVPHRW